jgi:hypothetical protein
MRSNEKERLEKRNGYQALLLLKKIWSDPTFDKPVAGFCFANAQRLALHSGGAFKYHEGSYIMETGIPHAHAWNSYNGAVIDTSRSIDVLRACGAPIPDAFIGTGDTTMKFKPLLTVPLAEIQRSAREDSQWNWFGNPKEYIEVKEDRNEY